jgi:hypothetical protein
MREDERDNLPLEVESSRGLCVRPIRDIPFDEEEGTVEPGTGGVSVSPDSPEYLPVMFRPPELGGECQDPCWCLEDSDLSEGIVYRDDPGIDGTPHGLLEPAVTMRLDVFQDLVAETRESWTKWP